MNVTIVNVRYVLLVGTLLSFHVCFAQTHVEKYFENLRKGQSVSLESEIKSFEKEKNQWPRLIPYLTDSLTIVQYHASFLLARVGHEKVDSNDRRKVVEHLLQVVRKQDASVQGLIARELALYHRDDFSTASKDSLRSILSQRRSHYSLWVKLIGYVGLTDQSNIIRSQLQQAPMSRSEKWAAQLALCRLGDVASLEKVLRRVKQLPVQDDVVYDVFPDLIYTRQREAINYLIEALYTDEKNCESSDAEKSQKQTCAYRLLELVAPVLRDFPLSVDASGDLAINDYEAGLMLAREWFKKRNGRYEIIDQTY